MTDPILPKKIRIILKKALASILVGAFLFNDVAIAADYQNLAPQSRLTLEQFKQQFKDGYLLLSHEVVNNYIREVIMQAGGFDKLEPRHDTINSKVNILIVPIAGLFIKMGQFAHVGLGKYNGMPVIYIDKKFFYDEEKLKNAKEEILRHEHDEISKYELIREILEEEAGGIRIDLRETWLKAHIETAVRFHGKSYDITHLYNLYSHLFTESDWLNLYELYKLHGLNKDDKTDFNIAAAAKRETSQSDVSQSIEKKTQVLVLCNQNQERSPVIAELLRNKLPHDLEDKVEISSAGLFKITKNEYIEKYTKRDDVLRHHDPREVTDNQIDKADIIFVMTKSQRNMLLEKYPQLKGKICLVLRNRDLEVDKDRDYDINEPYKLVRRQVTEKLRYIYEKIRKCTISANEEGAAAEDAVGKGSVSKDVDAIIAENPSLEYFRPFIHEFIQTHGSIGQMAGKRVVELGPSNKTALLEYLRSHNVDVQAYGQGFWNIPPAPYLHEVKDWNDYFNGECPPGSVDVIYARASLYAFSKFMKGESFERDVLIKETYLPICRALRPGGLIIAARYVPKGSRELLTESEMNELGLEFVSSKTVEFKTSDPMIFIVMRKKPAINDAAAGKMLSQQMLSYEKLFDHMLLRIEQIEHGDSREKSEAIRELTRWAEGHMVDHLYYFDKRRNPPVRRKAAPIEMIVGHLYEGDLYPQHKNGIVELFLDFPDKFLRKTVRLLVIVSAYPTNKRNHINRVLHLTHDKVCRELLIEMAQEAYLKKRPAVLKLIVDTVKEMETGVYRTPELRKAASDVLSEIPDPKEIAQHLWDSLPARMAADEKSASISAHSAAADTANVTKAETVKTPEGSPLKSQNVKRVNGIRSTVEMNMKIEERQDVIFDNIRRMQGEGLVIDDRQAFLLPSEWRALMAMERMEHNEINERICEGLKLPKHKTGLIEPILRELYKNVYNAWVSKIDDLGIKPEDFTGKVTTEAYYEGDNIIVSVIDNGKTIDLDTRDRPIKANKLPSHIPKSGVALDKIAEALSRIGGNIIFYPLKDGTKVQLRIPKKAVSDKFHIDDNEFILIETSAADVTTAETARMGTEEKGVPSGNVPSPVGRAPLTKEEREILENKGGPLYQFSDGPHNEQTEPSSSKDRTAHEGEDRTGAVKTAKTSQEPSPIVQSVMLTPEELEIVGRHVCVYRGNPEKFDEIDQQRTEEDLIGVGEDKRFDVKDARYVGLSCGPCIAVIINNKKKGVTYIAHSFGSRMQNVVETIIKAANDKKMGNAKNVEVIVGGAGVYSEIFEDLSAVDKLADVNEELTNRIEVLKCLSNNGFKNIQQFFPGQVDVGVNLAYDRRTGEVVAAFSSILDVNTHISIEEYVNWLKRAAGGLSVTSQNPTAAVENAGVGKAQRPGVMSQVRNEEPGPAGIGRIFTGENKRPSTDENARKIMQTHGGRPHFVSDGPEMDSLSIEDRAAQVIERFEKAFGKLSQTRKELVSTVKGHLEEVDEATLKLMLNVINAVDMLGTRIMTWQMNFDLNIADDDAINKLLESAHANSTEFFKKKDELPPGIREGLMRLIAMLAKDAADFRDASVDFGTEGLVDYLVKLQGKDAQPEATLLSQIQAVLTAMQVPSSDSNRIMEAFRTNRRDYFVPEKLKSLTYIDTAIAIGKGQTISQPSLVAQMTALLDLSGNETVLEVGTGSGWQAAILGSMLPHGQVYSLEVVESLAAQAAERLEKLKRNNVTVINTTGTAKLFPDEMFDRIIATAAAEEVPSALIDQLKTGGIIILPRGKQGESQKLMYGVKKRDNVGRVDMEWTDLGPVRFVPFVGAETDRYKTASAAKPTESSTANAAGDTTPKISTAAVENPSAAGAADVVAAETVTTDTSVMSQIDTIPANLLLAEIDNDIIMINGDRYQIVPIDSTFANNNSEDILRLVNEVPGSYWNKDKLLEEYPGKWQNSFAVINEAGGIIAILLAYNQAPSEELHISHKHIFIRRLCTDRRFMVLGIARRLLNHLALRQLPNTYIALQTNAENIPANKVYQNLNFDHVATLPIDSHSDNIYMIKADKLVSSSGYLTARNEMLPYLSRDPFNTKTETITAEDNTVSQINTSLNPHTTTQVRILGRKECILKPEFVRSERAIAAEQVTVVFDLDETIRYYSHPRASYVLREGMTEQLRKLKSHGIRLVLWTNNDAVPFFEQFPEMRTIFDLAISGYNFNSPSREELAAAYGELAAGSKLSGQTIDEIFERCEHGQKDIGLLGYPLIVDDSASKWQMENLASRLVAPSLIAGAYQITKMSAYFAPNYREDINDLSDIILARLRELGALTVTAEAANVASAKTAATPADMLEAIRDDDARLTDALSEKGITPREVEEEIFKTLVSREVFFEQDGKYYFTDMMQGPRASDTQDMINLVNDIMGKEKDATPEILRAHIVDYVYTHPKKTKVFEKIPVIRIWNGYSDPAQNNLLQLIRQKTKDGPYKVEFGSIEKLVNLPDGDSVTILPFIKGSTDHLRTAEGKVIFIDPASKSPEKVSFELAQLEGLIGIGRAYLNDDSESFYRLYRIMAEKPVNFSTMLSELKKNPILFVESLHFILKPIVAKDMDEQLRINNMLTALLIAA
jgi:protein-L-isoaspartate(D-aspartate) O-methyltransferase